MRLFAAAAPGLEGVVEKEVAALVGVSAPQQVVGGVEFGGDLAVLYRANLHLRCASRVLLRIGDPIAAREFAALVRGVAALPFRDYIAADFPVKLSLRVTCHRSRLYHSDAIAERVYAALADSGVHTQNAADTLEVVIRGEDDRFTVSLDTSGELLHLRGWRKEAGPAPLRETLAAGLLHLAGFDAGGKMALRDPTCGSGTLLIEAALMAARRAPGLLRSFAFQRFANYREPLFRSLVLEAQAMARALPAQLIAGSDVSETVVELARRNAERAGVADLVNIECRDVAKLRLPSQSEVKPGLVLCNPPYGKRLSDGDPHQLYRAIGRYARSTLGWQLGLFCPQRWLARAAGRHFFELPLSNGGLPVSLFISRRAPALGKDRDYTGQKEDADGRLT